MTTARDLALVALSLPPDRTVERGDLSLALAGAEAIDLLAAGALALDGDRMVPGPEPVTGDRLLDQAVTALVGREPYETVEDWLWRRGSGLAGVYAKELEGAGLLEPSRARGLRPRSSRSVPTDAPERRRAAERQASGEPVLAALTSVLSMEDTSSDHHESPDGDAVTKVVGAVGDAVTELRAVRLRRDVEDAAFDNIWRG
ncbi:GPP34 family phosphoprotein [Streptomyces sp. NPDC003635]